MSQRHNQWGVLLSIAALIVILWSFFGIVSTWQKIWPPVKSNAMEENVSLRNENQRLKGRIAHLRQENSNLRKYLEISEHSFDVIKDVARNCGNNESMFSAELLEGIAKEPMEIRRIFIAMLSEKNRWDRYQQERYIDILESTVEPDIIETQDMALANEDNRQYFMELEGALKLHRRLIRDVRLFHDEIQFQKRQHQAQQEYELYDLKFNLSPFARESALADALQQAMSALSAGIYQQEALEVLDRIGDAFTGPIQMLYEQSQESAESPKRTQYNYNFYTVFGKKLMDYSDTLSQQSAIALGPTAFGELDYFNRQLYERLYELYEAGHDETIDPSHLDLEELEQVLYYRY